MPAEAFSSPSANRRGRRRTRPPAAPDPPSRLPAPSTGLLSLFAVVATANTAHASPTPPLFLCPGLGPDACPRTSTAPTHRKRSSSKKKSDRTVPDKYEEGEDGVWRKVDYSLHGGGSCSSATSTYLDDDTKFSVSPTSSSTASATASVDMAEASTHLLETLPNGWKPTASAPSSRTTLILALSLALAICICVFMIACIFWRKGNRRKGREKDMEMKLRRRRRDPEEEEALAAQQEAEVKQRTMTRLISRWKANTRSSARYRRSRKVLRALHAGSVSAHSPPSDDEAPRSRYQSPSSPRTSTSSRSSATHLDSSPVAEAQTSAVDLEPPVLPPQQPDAHALPPAYHRRTPPPSISTTSEEFDSGPSDVKSPALAQDQAFNHGTPNEAPQGPFAGSSEEFRAPHAAHVATDDKALLAQLARQASAPPAAAQRPEPSSYSAPLWVDEEVENLADVMAPVGGRASPDSYRAAGGSGSAFPDPPTKGQMAALMDSQDYEYHDVFLDAMPVPGPSAPPFDFGHDCATAPAGPPALPSAPPLFEDVGEEEAFGGREGSMGASAPPLDDGEVLAEAQEEATAPAEGDEDEVEELEYAESDGEGKGPGADGVGSERQAALDAGQGHDRNASVVENVPHG